jgi:hypothetical protein
VFDSENKNSEFGTGLEFKVKMDNYTCCGITTTWPSVESETGNSKGDLA